jgi:hypothetical protein
MFCLGRVSFFIFGGGFKNYCFFQIALHAGFDEADVRRGVSAYFELTRNPISDYNILLQIINNSKKR